MISIKDITFNVLAASVPVLVSTFIQDEVIANKFIKISLSSITSFVFLLLLTYIMEILSQRMTYSGQWVLDISKIDSDKIENIGIGIIKFDRRTRTYTFSGKLFDSKATELFIWDVGILHLEKDNSTERVCIMKNDTEPIALGHLRFTNNNECEGTIWLLSGGQCRLNGYRITSEMITRNADSSRLKKFYNTFGHSPTLMQESYATFVLQRFKEHQQR